jgi:hypothetical protein
MGPGGFFVPFCMQVGSLPEIAVQISYSRRCVPFIRGFSDAPFSPHLFNQFDVTVPVVELKSISNPSSAQ